MAIKSQALVDAEKKILIKAKAGIIDRYTERPSMTPEERDEYYVAMRFKRGESIFDLSKEFGISLEEIVRCYRKLQSKINNLQSQNK